MPIFYLWKLAALGSPNNIDNNDNSNNNNDNNDNSNSNNDNSTCNSIVIIISITIIS